MVDTDPQISKNLSAQNDEYYNSIEDQHSKGAISLTIGAKAYQEAMHECISEKKSQLFKKAAHWYEISAQLGNGQAATNLGYMYQFGRLGTKDKEEAARWYEIGSGLGNEEACYKLGDCYYYASGKPHDVEQAYQWYCKANDLARKHCDYKNPEDNAVIGSIYLRLATSIEHGAGDFENEDRLAAAYQLYKSAEQQLRAAEYGGITWYRKQLEKAREGVQRTEQYRSPDEIFDF